MDYLWTVRIPRFADRQRGAHFRRINTFSFSHSSPFFCQVQTVDRTCLVSCLQEVWVWAVWLYAGSCWFAWYVGVGSGQHVVGLVWKLWFGVLWRGQPGEQQHCLAAGRVRQGVGCRVMSGWWCIAVTVGIMDLQCPALILTTCFHGHCFLFVSGLLYIIFSFMHPLMACWYSSSPTGWMENSVWQGHESKQIIECPL